MGLVGDGTSRCMMGLMGDGISRLWEIRLVGDGSVGDEISM